MGFLQPIHPTKTIADKISAVLLYVPELLLHVSRGVRWDSDHVVIYNGDRSAIAQEIARGGFLDRVYIRLDYFDASINRVAAYAIGARNTLRAVWDDHCLKHDVPVGLRFMDKVRAYENKVLAKRA